MNDLSVGAAVILGIIQGMTEFLPISSSGHLVITPWILGFSDPGLAFDVALHVGTLIAVITFFFWDWMALLGLRNDARYPHPRRLLGMIILGTIPAVIVGVLINDVAEGLFRSPLLVAATLAVFGIVLFGVDRIAQRMRTMNDLSFSHAVFIGVVQCLALIPGVSRSGITMTAGRLLGLTRAECARFSFLLSTPVIFGAATLHFSDFIALSGSMVFWAGIAASALSGFAAIALLLRMITTWGFGVFVAYRLVLAATIVGLVAW